MAEASACDIGLAKNESCPLEMLRAGSIRSVDNMDDTTVQFLRLRSGCFSAKTVCEHHFVVYITNFKKNQRKCCNPFLDHKNVVKKNLREISQQLALHIRENLNIGVAPGEKICTNCIKKVNSSLKTTQTEKGSPVEPEVQLSENEDFNYVLPAEENLKKLNATVLALGGSPVTLKRLAETRRSKYVQKKAKKIATLAEHTLTSSLGESDLPGKKQ